MDKTATIRDVAARSGFSVPTVSRVLSGSSYPASREGFSLVLYQWRPELQPGEVILKKLMDKPAD